MSNITRRNLLTGIAGCSLAAALGCEDEGNKNAGKDQDKSAAKDQAAVRSQATSSPPTKLNVLIHGLSVFYVNQGPKETGIQLYMPLIVDMDQPPDHDKDHRYLFGNIQDVPSHAADLLIPIGPTDVCTLSGVKPSVSRPDESLFKADLLFPQATVNSPASLRQFVLPWTTAIQSVAKVKRNTPRTVLLEDNRPHPAHNYGNVLQLSTICILTYDITGQPKITNANGDTGWSPLPSATNPDYANLHIYAEPKKGTAGHAVEAFKTLMDTINQPLLKFRPFPDRGMDKIPDTSIPGTAGIDLLHLNELLDKAGEVANCVRAVVIA